MRRRLFFGLANFAAACSLPFGGRSCTDEDEEAGLLDTPGFIIDSHTHYRAADDWERAFLEVYGKWNAMACLLIGLNDLKRGIRFSLVHPDRVIPYAAIEIDSPNVLDDIRRAHDMGFMGLGELFARGDWNYDDPEYDPLWALAMELKMPVAPHTGILSSGQMSRMRPGYLGTISVKFPGLIIHAAHFGNPWYNEAGEIARRCSNVYFDMTGSSLIKKHDDPSFWRRYLWWTEHIGKAHMPADAVPAFQKIVFATDEHPRGFEDNIIRFNKVLNACGVSDETRRKCYYETVAGIHGIDTGRYLKG